MNRKDAADQQRIEPEDRHVFVAAIAHASRWRCCRRVIDSSLRFLQRIPELKAAIDEIDARAAAAVAAGILRLVDAVIAEPPQFLLERVGAERLADVQLGRFGIDLRRQRPAAAFELRGDDAIQVEQPAEQGDQADADDQRGAHQNLLAEFLQR